MYCNCSMSFTRILALRAITFIHFVKHKEVQMHLTYSIDSFYFEVSHSYYFLCLHGTRWHRACSQVK